MNNNYDGKSCPYCGSNNFNPSDIPQYADDNRLELSMECDDCGVEWLQVYGLLEWKEVIE